MCTSMWQAFEIKKEFKILKSLLVLVIKKLSNNVGNIALELQRLLEEFKDLSPKNLANELPKLRNI